MLNTKAEPSRRRHDDVFHDILELDKIAISVRSHKLLKQLLTENHKLEEIMQGSSNEIEALEGVRNWIMSILENSTEALKFYKSEHEGRKIFESLKWCDYAAIRLLDYIDSAGREFEDLNLRGEVAINNPIKMIWLAVRNGVGGAKPYFFEDMIHLFRQLSGKLERKLPDKDQMEEWMARWPSGLDPHIMQLREENKKRILNIIIDCIDKGEISSRSFN